ncbi:MAG: hypothetical protein ACSLFM_02810 [Tepidiformaceae bacterium]
MAYHPEDLSDLESAFLGVLCIGLPPSRAAGDDRFRADHCAAVVAGLLRTGDANRFLGADGIRVSQEFRGELRTAIDSLVAKGLVAHAPMGMPAAAGGFEAGLEIDLVDPDQQPAVLDRYLAQLCMESLFQVPAVYPFLMERYTKSGEVWRRIREAGYAS